MDLTQSLNVRGDLYSQVPREDLVSPIPLSVLKIGEKDSRQTFDGVEATPSGLGSQEFLVVSPN